MKKYHLKSEKTIVCLYKNCVLTLVWAKGWVELSLLKRESCGVDAVKVNNQQGLLQWSGAQLLWMREQKTHG